MTENNELMLIRGRYVTLEAEQKKLVLEFNAMKHYLQTLLQHLDGHNPVHCISTQSFKDSATTLEKMIDLQTKIRVIQLELERLKPMTGL